jgi:putative flippase GtrA
VAGLVESVRGWAQTPKARVVLRYCVLSVVNVVVGQGLIAVFFLVAGLGAVASNLSALAVGLLPAYWVHRHWVWRRTGRSHVVKEVVPFCVLILLSLVVSTGFAALAASSAPTITPSRSGQTVVVVVFIGFGYGVAWVLRFFVLDRFVFTDRAAHAAKRALVT